MGRVGAAGAGEPGCGGSVGLCVCSVGRGAGECLPMGHLEAAHLILLPDGRALLGDVWFRVGEGAVVALVGPDGAGKTTLLG